MLRLKTHLFKICFLWLLLFIASLPAYAQSNNNAGIYFQAIARDNFTNPAKDRNIYVESSVIQNSPNGLVLLKERFKTQTDLSGVFNVIIGQGYRMSGVNANLNDINWSHGPFYLNLKIAIEPVAPIINWDYTGSLIDLGTSLFGVVPDALFARTVLGFENKLNISDTASMLAPYALAVKSLMNNINNNPNIIQPVDNTTSTLVLDAKINLADSNLIYTTPFRLNQSIIDTTNLSKLIAQSIKVNDTSYMLSAYARNNNLFNGDYNRLTNKPILFDGNYTSLTNKPILFSGAYNDLTSKPILFSGSYNDLTSKPSLFDGEYISLANRPILFNGDYNALSNKPTISLTGDITSVGSATTLSISGVVSGTYGSALAIPTITVDTKGRITSASSTTITPNNFPNKTNAEKNAMPISTATGTVIWCSNCGPKGQLQVYNGTEWTDLTGATGLTSGIVFTALNINSITSSTAAASTGISSDGGASITAKGVVWSTNVNPTIALSTKTNDGTGTSSYTSSLSGLSTSTLYYIRAYATNTNGTVYGAQQSFTTLGDVPTLTTTSVTSISLTGAITGGNISADGGTTITSRGVCWSTSPNPTINDNKLVNGNGTGSYTVNLTGLTGGTTYYVSAYATNAAGTGYGSPISFNTSAIAPGVAYLGGKIAYIFQSGDVGYVAGQTHGFIIMNHPMGMQVPFTPTSSNLYFTSMNFGTGMSNTQILNGATGNGATAAKSMYGIMYDGYNDWYIPSYYEWFKIAIGWSSLGIADGIYHSSSEQSSGYCFTIQFYNSGSSYQSRSDGKSSLYSVIGIRKF